MILNAGMYDVPGGHVATIVTHLEMTTPTMPAQLPFPDGITATSQDVDPVTYRAIFRSVGGPWLWTSRLLLDDAALAKLLDDPLNEIWVLRQDGTDIGLIELDFSKPQECELVLFGMVPTATGQGLGGPMMALAQSRAFARKIRLFTVHTCHLDDPRALAFYQRMGFNPVKRAVEVFADPRLTGTHDPAIAPHIPCLK
ncbi:GNAT family N-acetyltransferase [Yoonia sp.]|uniref:GNAT family N-acetyltransferase n=1 Tax=Yoonia sp. TaxID=2212373 RepID=UPI0035C7BE1F